MLYANVVKLLKYVFTNLVTLSVMIRLRTPLLFPKSLPILTEKLFVLGMLTYVLSIYTPLDFTAVLLPSGLIPAPLVGGGV